MPGDWGSYPKPLDPIPSLGQLLGGRWSGVLSTVRWVFLTSNIGTASHYGTCLSPQWMTLVSHSANRGGMHRTHYYLYILLETLGVSPSPE